MCHMCMYIVYCVYIVYIYIYIYILYKYIGTSKSHPGMSFC